MMSPLTLLNWSRFNCDNFACWQICLDLNEPHRWIQFCDRNTGQQPTSPLDLIRVHVKIFVQYVPCGWRWEPQFMWPPTKESILVCYHTFAYSDDIIFITLISLTCWSYCIMQKECGPKSVNDSTDDLFRRTTMGAIKLTKSSIGCENWRPIFEINLDNLAALLKREIHCKLSDCIDHKFNQFIEYNSLFG